jgi:predicted DNA-binding transcriptional regulator YafY
MSDGSVLLKFRVDGLEKILWWILGWCGRVQALEPSSLREMVVEQLKKALTMNDVARPSVRNKPGKRAFKS